MASCVKITGSYDLVNLKDIKNMLRYWLWIGRVRLARHSTSSGNPKPVTRAGNLLCLLDARRSSDEVHSSGKEPRSRPGRNLVYNVGAYGLVSCFARSVVVECFAGASVARPG